MDRRLQIMWIKNDTALLQKLQIFVLKRSYPMMFLLTGNAMLHRFALRGTDGKSPVTLLPGKSGQANLLMHPARGGAFDFTQHIRQTVGGTQSGKDMDMILHSSNDFRNDFQRGKNASDVGVKTGTPSRCDESLVIFGAKNQVIIKTEMR